MSLPVDGRKYIIPYKKSLLRQATCEDPALTTSYSPPVLSHDLKHFYPSQYVQEIDAGTHGGRTVVDGSINTSVAILHLHEKCYDTYMKNMKEALVSLEVISSTISDAQNLEALEKIKDKFQGGCGMIICHKAAEYYWYLKNPAKFKEGFAAKTAFEAEDTYTALRDRVLRLGVKYGDDV